MTRKAPRSVSIALVAAVVSVSLSARAQDSATPREAGTPPTETPSTSPDATANASDDKTFSALLDTRLGFGGLDEDFYLSLNIGAAFRWWKLGVGVQAPLRFRVIDRSPKQKEVFRKQDWDEPSDWTRILRYISWGAPGEWIYGRIGVLTGITLGNGTLVDRYYNTIDADHFQTGLSFELNLDGGGTGLFLDNLLDPEMAGVRGYVQPFAFGDFGALAKAFQVGFTLVIDGAAPMQPVLDSTQSRQLDGSSNLKVQTEPLVFVGFDLAWQVQPTDWVVVRPYTDLNVWTQTGGLGYHLGLLATFDIAGAVTLGTRVEYRALSADYSPSWVNSWYEVERLDFLPDPVTGRQLTKARYFRDRHVRGQDEIRHGWHWSLDLTILDAVTISGIFEDYQGEDNANLMLRLALPYIAGVKLSAYYAKRNFEGVENAFDLDRGLLVAEARYKFWGPMAVFARYSREWRIERDRAATNFGEYETIDDWDVGIGAEFTF